MIDRKYKLNWPEGEPRTPTGDRRKRSPFSMNFDKALRELDNELQLFHALDVVLTHNDNRRELQKPKDAAAVLYFTLGGRDISIPCDLYFNVQDNIRAIGQVVKAMRRMEMYGGSRMSQKSFTGFVALPPPKDVWSILGLNQKLGQGLNQRMRREYVMDGFRTKAKEIHGAGGDMAALVEARDLALKELGVTDG